ncbi:hypothetical protein PV10_06030 [Exophiala mesophila]|uniref:N-acetyltransferase domain-containing protein n=1 Tax=Exophiala mesophila TaxID=212818 RepID=A0A0D1XTM6_EXOME|nr:uncharacterized protein PV10_06030 [Exophiala mesophila]KIV91496.1 hypothetical protein PV10_06030 [Exophiala mesophila]
MPQTNILSFFSRPKQDPPVTPVQEQEVLETEHTPESLENQAEDNDNDQAHPQATNTSNTNETSSTKPKPSILSQVHDHLSSNNLSQPVTIPHLPHALIVPLSPSQLPSIQRLTSTTLPIRYSDSFFREPLNDTTLSQLTRVVLYSSEPVGWMRCRIEPASPTTTGAANQPQLHQIYIQALALLAPYRGLGLATLLLDTVLSTPIAKDESTVSVYAHVWEKNEDALEWYEKRGFYRVLLVQRYYRRLNPGGAWIVRKELH